MNASSECKKVVGVSYSISGLIPVNFTALSSMSNFRPGKLRYMLSFPSIVKSAGTKISDPKCMLDAISHFWRAFSRYVLAFEMRDLKFESSP